MTYDNASPISVPPAGKCQPGVQAFVTFHVDKWGLPSLGCYNPNSKLPDGSPSLHRDGRAADVGHDGSDSQIALVWDLCGRLVRNGVALGVQQILWQGQGWRQESGWRPLSASTDPHMSHAHVEFTLGGSAENTEHDYVRTLGVKPMDEETIRALASAIADALLNAPIRVHDYGTGAERDIPLSVVISYGLAEASQIRHHLTGQPLK